MSVINPKEIVDRGLIENIDDGKFEVQQNGIDITLGKVEIINGGMLTSMVSFCLIHKEIVITNMNHGIGDSWG